MRELSIEHLGSSVLREPAREVAEVDDDLRELIRAMFAAMYEADGQGLAVPQVGVSRRIAIVDVPPRRGTPTLSPDLAPAPTDVRAMLERDAAAESRDVRNYVHLATLAERAELVALRLKMEEQAGDEHEHGQEMRRLLG